MDTSSMRGPERRRAAANPLGSSIRTRSMTASSSSSTSLSALAADDPSVGRRVKAPLPRSSSRNALLDESAGAGLRRTGSLRAPRRLGSSNSLARKADAAGAGSRGARKHARTASVDVAPLQRRPPSPEKLGFPQAHRMPLSPKSPRSRNIPGPASNPFDLTSPGKRERMVYRSPEKGTFALGGGNKAEKIFGDEDMLVSSDDEKEGAAVLGSGAKRQLFTEREGPTVPTSEAPRSATKRPRSPSPIFSSSPQRPPPRPLGSVLDPRAFLQPPRRQPPSSSSPLEEKPDEIDFLNPRKKAKYDEDDESLRPPTLGPLGMHIDPLEEKRADAMEVDDAPVTLRVPSSEGPDIASLELASPTRFRQPAPLIFGSSLTPARPAPMAIPTINTVSADSTTPPGTPPPPRSPYRAPPPLGSVFGTMTISPRRVSPIKEATMPTSIPLRSPSPERPRSPLSNEEDGIPSSRFLRVGVLSDSLTAPAPMVRTQGLSYASVGMNSLESIEEERSPMKGRTEAAATAPPTVAAATRSSTLKSKYRGLAGATIPRPPAGTSSSAIPTSTNARTISAAAGSSRSGIPRATSGAALPSAPGSSNLAGAAAAPRAQETNDRLAKLQAMLDKMSSGRPTTARTSIGGGAPDSTSAKPAPRATFAGKGLPTSSSTTAVNNLAPATELAKQITGRRRSSSSGSTTAPPTANAAGQVLSRSGAPLGSLRSSAQRRASQILPSSTSFSRLDASTGKEVEMKPREGPLQDVVAFVDVRTAEGDDAGQVFVEMLKGLGAKVLSRPTYPLTHIIFKGGKPGTIDKWSCHPEPKPWIVGIGWVVRCREVMARAAENPYVVEITKEAVASKRRRSMEPKALALANAGLNVSMSGPVPPVRPSLAASIEQAKRKSLQFAPKIGSPLSRRVFDASSLLTNSDEDS